MAIGDFINKAKELVGDHPDQARNVLDRAEQMIDERTGGKFSEQIHQGGDFVEGQLGIPADQAADSAPADTAPADATPTTADSAPTDAFPPEPTDATAPADASTDAPADEESTSISDEAQSS